ncbi:MAG: hypothetical protein JXR76_14440 [Deltaproteobacteria bacterium]|nr:hypothetical protein [Deltaproteobacteria bacterium]
MDGVLQWHFALDELSFDDATITFYHIDNGNALKRNVETGVLGGEGSIHGIWIQPESQLPTGEYVVDISGTSGGSWGYRVLVTDCGTGAPDTCDVFAQDCGADYLGCYVGREADRLCSYAGYLDKGTPCPGSGLCKPGLICTVNTDETMSVCSPHCDSNIFGTPTSCDVMCEGMIGFLPDDSTVCLQ